MLDSPLTHHPGLPRRLNPSHPLASRLAVGGHSMTNGNWFSLITGANYKDTTVDAVTQKGHANAITASISASGVSFDQGTTKIDCRAAQTLFAVLTMWYPTKNFDFYPFSYNDISNGSGWYPRITHFDTSNYNVTLSNWNNGGTSHQIPYRHMGIHAVHATNIAAMSGSTQAYGHYVNGLAYATGSIGSDPSHSGTDVRARALTKVAGLTDCTMAVSMFGIFRGELTPAEHRMFAENPLALLAPFPSRQRMRLAIDAAVSTQSPRSMHQFRMRRAA